MAKGRFWSMESVRAMCIKHRLYTHGNNEEYAHMLNKVDENEVNPSNSVIREVAEDILQHSSPSKGLKIDDVLCFLEDEVIHELTCKEAKNDEPDLGD